MQDLVWAAVASNKEFQALLRAILSSLVFVHFFENFVISNFLSYYSLLLFVYCVCYQ